MEIEVALDYDVIPADRERQVLLLARATATPAAQSGRAPLNISVVIDRSGSMAGQKLEYVKNAAQLIPQYLSANDLFSLVTYDQYIDTLLPPQPVVEKDRIRNAIRRIAYGWGTNLSGGWLEGCQLIAQGMRRPDVGQKRPVGFQMAREDSPGLGQINRVFLLTDGIANMGIVDANRLAALAAQKREEGIITTTIGVGMDFNEDLLTRMALEGGGEFYFIDSPDQAPNIFTRMLGYLLGIVAQNLTVTVTPLGGARLIRQIGTYRQILVAADTTYRLGDLTLDERKFLLLELSLPRLHTLGEVEIAKVRFDFEEVDATQVIHRAIEQSAFIKVAPEDEAEHRLPNRVVVKAALLLQASRARESAMRSADEGDFGTAAAILSLAADEIEKSGLVDDDLQAEHDLLREEAVNMELGAERYDAHMRKVGTANLATLGLPQTAGVTKGFYDRMRESRMAIERYGPTPTVMKSKQGLTRLTMNLLRFGRADDNDIVIPEDVVSNHHCQIVREGNNLVLYDLSSRNGTFANGGLVEELFRLSAGDVVTIGSWLFRFE